ncbi:MAG: hypothetical protein R2843_00370 [Thermomicrobiales bacterium]
MVLEGGDVVLYGVDTDGNVIINDRGFTFRDCRTKRASPVR